MKTSEKYSAITIALFNLICVFSNAQSTDASFNTNLVAGCLPLTIQFTNTSVNASSYHWDFGNGNNSILANPSNVYSTPGTYSVKLVSVSANGQKDSVVSNNLITVVSNSVSNFYSSNTSACLEGNTISFVNTSLNSTSFLWDFGDGNTSTLQNPSHSYSTPGNYTTKLIAYNSFGCSDVKTIANYIHVIPNPSNSFAVDVTTACSVNRIFNFTSTTPSVNSWLWNFGDGTTSALSAPSHTYSNAGTYTVSLITSNGSGCSDTLTKNNYISIFANQTPTFTVSTASGCTQIPIVFANTSANSASWLWNFGDNGTSTQQNPTHVFQNAGNYSVSLTITTANNCSYTTTINNYLSIQSNAVSSFSPNNTTGCAPLNVQFTNLSTNDVTRLWEFGDGTTSTIRNPSHTYSTNGTYPVKLHSYNASGCESVYQNNNAVIVAPPLADFSANFSPSCAPLSANFTNTSTNSSQWIWDFGDGASSILKNPVHTYNFPGDYDVRLIASNMQGCSDTLIFHSCIHVINTVVNYTPPPTITGCVPLSTAFSNSTNGAVSWLWNFGDGTTSTLQNPSHTFIANGFYTVSLTIQLNGGCTQVYPVFRTFSVQGGEAHFTYTKSQCAPYIVNFTDTTSGNWVSWLWVFGDGATSILQNPTHTYSNQGLYSVVYTATSSAGCSSKIIQSNLIRFVKCSATDSAALVENGFVTGVGSVAGSGNDEGVEEGGMDGDTLIGGTGSITYSVPRFQGCIPVVINFHNSFAGTTSWFWDFGDGTTSVLENPVHSYITEGNFNVTMIVHNSTGVSYTRHYYNYVHVSGINTDFSFTQNSDCLNSTLIFTGVSQNATQWSWNFGDGITSQIQNPTHSYFDSINNYTIQLTTNNADGCSSSMSKNVINSQDSPVIWANKYNTCANQSVSFNCSSSNYIAYLWDFNDGTTSSLQNPTHSYQNGGTFQVTLILTSNNGCVHNFSLSIPITVSNPIAEFTSALTNSCNSQTVNFTNSSSGTSLPLSAHCKWNFGDGSPVQWAENALHPYANQGTYQVTLSVNHDSSCFNSISKTISIYPTVIADFSSTQNTTCFPITVTFNNLSTNAISCLWDFGDGTTSILQSPVHTFTVLPSTGVTLTITDASGCQSTKTKPAISVFNTNFSLSVTNGCAPLNVTFSDSSLNADNWLWNFGDGTISTLQNPSHIYINNGSYPVTLISKTATGCIDTMVFNPINVNKPTANFISPNPTNCSPTLVSFTDLSNGSSNWLWDFGDGSTSVNQNPAHIYNIPGVCTIKLIVKDNLGCADTLIRSDYIKVPGTIANFGTSANQFCAKAVIQFTDSSINASSWNWNFGDGNTSSQQNPSNSYQNDGHYPISLIVHDSFGCVSNFILTSPVIINPMPVSNFTISDRLFCSPFSVSFYNDPQNAVTYLWNFGDGDTSTLQNPSHLYLNSGTYTASLIATNEFGCSDTGIYNSIVANTMPVANFTSNVTSGCSPLIVSFDAASNPISNANYSWDFGNDSTSTAQNPSTTFINPGTYSISLIISNNTGCIDTVIKTAYIEVDDFNPPVASSILFVTVTSENSTSLLWNQSTASDFSYYKIYRKDILTGNYLPIGIKNSISEVSFFDNNLNTSDNSYCYKVQTFDGCGYALPLDSLSEHCTINARANGINDNIRVNWTPYIGAAVDTYSIYRMEIGSLTAVLIATVPSDVLSIIDTNLYCPLDFSYRVKACNLNGTIICSNSDTSIARPAINILAQQQVDVVRSTIINNSEVLTEWATPIISPEKITGYRILKSTNNRDFSLLATVNALTHDYLDNDVDINMKNYYYKIEVENFCNVTTMGSNKSSSILLKAELAKGNILLSWTKYEGWSMGVDYYIIEKMDDEGEWKIIKKINGNQLNCEDE